MFRHREHEHDYRQGINVEVCPEHGEIDVILLNSDESANAAAKSAEEAIRAKDAAQELEELAKGHAEKAEEAKKQVDSDVTYLDEAMAETKELKEGLDDSILAASDVRDELDGSIETANTQKAALDESTKAGEQAESALNSAIETAGTAKGELDQSIVDAVTKKEELDGSILAGSDVKGELDASAKSAGTAQEDLEGKIVEAQGVLDDFSEMIQGVTVSAEKVPAGGEPTAEVMKDGNLHITFGLVEGEKGADGRQGIDGKSAFDIAKELHPEFETEEQWLESLKGKDASEEQIAAAVQAELEKMQPEDIGAAEAEHTHDYAGSAESGGAANSAVKVEHALTMGGKTFDGSVAIALKLYDLVEDGAGAHNSVYRGIELGKSVTAEQYAAIADGSFRDLYIGDYWTIDGKVYRIAAFDYYLHCGDTADLTTHHAVLVPDKVMYYTQMRKTSTGEYIADDLANTTDGAYYNTDLRKTGMETAKSTIKAAFAEHVLEHRIYYANAATGGNVTGFIVVNDDVEIMNENMVYGTNIFTTRSYGTNVLQWNHTLSKSQLPLFAMRPDLICQRENYWLRDVANQRSFALVNAYGRAYCSYASYVFGVRPAFCIF